MLIFPTEELKGEREGEAIFLTEEGEGDGVEEERVALFLGGREGEGGVVMSRLWWF